jgi:hypothetical protein
MEGAGVIINLRPIKERISAGQASDDTMALVAEVERLMRELADAESLSRKLMSEKLRAEAEANRLREAVKHHRGESLSDNIFITPALADKRLWEVLGDA